MDFKIKNHIKFLIIDSINDDIRGIYELSQVIKQHYYKSDIQKQIEIIRVQMLMELIDENYVRVIKMTNPGFEEIESIDKKNAEEIILQISNWNEYQDEWIYGIETVNLEKSIELESELYKKL